MSLLELLYPKKCPICLDALPFHGELICAPCKKKIRYVRGPVCMKCGKPLREEWKEYCANCERQRPVFTKGIAYSEYTSKYIRRMLAEVKYHGHCQLLDYPCSDFANRQKTFVEKHPMECLIPVPVHKSRYKERGYNQAEEITERLSKIWKIPVEKGYLIRDKKTIAQKELGDMERRKNLEGAFSIQGKKKTYKSVGLVDDIYTTGATINACAKVLKATGIEEIYVFTLAIGRENQS